MKKKPIVYLFGKDDWALGTEYRLAREYLSRFTILVENPSEAEFWHSVDVEGVVNAIYRGELLPKAPIIGAINNHPTRLIEWPGFIDIAKRYLYLVPQSNVATKDMERLGLHYPCRSRIATDANSYRPMDRDDPELLKLRRQFSIPNDVYLIGLLQRDSEGNDLTVPKKQKGPDIFLALMMLLKKKEPRKTHVLLGGPRRHWIRKHLDKHSIPYTFVGNIMDGDDYPSNILDKEMMCRLYNLLDLYIIPTRWEGAPRQVFDVVECGRKIISTPVGIVPEILPRECIFENIPRAVDIIIRDMKSGFLEQFIGSNRLKIAERHTIQRVSEQWEMVYNHIIAKEMKNTINTRPILLFPAGRPGPIIFQKPVSFLLNKTRIDQYKKKHFPLKLAIVVKGTEKKRIFGEMSEILLRRGIKLTNNIGRTKHVLVWMKPDAEIDEKLFHKGKRIILIVDEDCCKVLLNINHNLRDRLRLMLKRAKTTILTSDDCLSGLVRADVHLVNPVVVRFPIKNEPNRREFNHRKHNKSANTGLAVMHSGEGTWNRWIDKLAKQQDFQFKIVDLNNPTDTDPTSNGALEKLSAHNFAVIISDQVSEAILTRILSSGLPCIYFENHSRIKSRVGMAGLSMKAGDSFGDACRMVCENLTCFQTVITTPNLTETADSIAKILHFPNFVPTG